MKWQKVAFEDVNKYSQIPNSIGDAAEVKKKTSESILQEYNIEKWGALRSLSRRLALTEHSHLAERAHKDAGERLCLSKNDIYFASALDISNEYVAQTITRLESMYFEHNCNCLVELGAGYGRLLSPLALSLGSDNVSKIYGLDYTDAAIEILRNIFCESGFDVASGKIDLSGSSDSIDLPGWQEEFKPLVFSSQAIMYVPILSQSFIRKMNVFKSGVFCFVEPSVFNLTMSPLKVLQDRYIYINDYNTNLADLLERNFTEGIIKNLVIDNNILSENAFLPLQRFDWQFA